MHVIQYSNRIYTFVFLCLCAAFFLAPTLANANEYWSTYEKRMISQSEVSNRVNRMLSQATSMPSNATLSTVPSAPTITKNAAGGLSATTNNILKTLDQPSTFNSTLNNSVGAAQTALKSCIRSPVCATRALGAGGVIYEGIQGWKEVYGLLLGENGGILVEKTVPVIAPPTTPDGATCQLSGVGNFSSCESGFHHYNQQCQVADPPWICPVSLEPRPSGDGYIIKRSDGGTAANLYYISNACPSGSNNSYYGCQTSETTREPLTESYLDDSLENYEPDVTDAPIVLLSGEPETISLTTPEPANLPATTTTSTDSQGKTTTTIKNAVITYNILNNNSSSPSIESTITETSNTYDETANLVESMTSTTTNNAVAPDPFVQSPPSVGVEIPPFCTWASIVCDWIGWTKEGIEGEEPDLINLISEFEPDESQYNSGIGSGSCPAPMSLNIGIINRTVEVSYQPFCDFLDMIRPLVIAGAWLLSAFMYVGVLRRG